MKSKRKSLQSRLREIEEGDRKPQKALQGLKKLAPLEELRRLRAESIERQRLMLPTKKRPKKLKEKQAPKPLPLAQLAQEADPELRARLAEWIRSGGREQQEEAKRNAERQRKYNEQLRAYVLKGKPVGTGGDFYVNTGHMRKPGSHRSQA